jgi:predicted PhzF superfamily epimerase YddE/YHI9
MGTLYQYSTFPNSPEGGNPAGVWIRQGETMGRPSLLTLDIPAAGGIVVSGSGVPL